jgi:hypothetical protein
MQEPWCRPPPLRKIAIACLAIVIVEGLAYAAPIRVVCRDGVARMSARLNQKRFRDDRSCDADAACDGQCVFNFLPEWVECSLNPPPPSEPQECPFALEDSPCNVRVTVPVGPKRRPGRADVVLSGAGRVILRCRPGRRRCGAPTSSTTTTLPGALLLSGNWRLDGGTVDSTCPPGIAANFETGVRIAQQGTALRGCSAVVRLESYSGTSEIDRFVLLDRARPTIACQDGFYSASVTITGARVGADLVATQTKEFVPLGDASCPPCRMVWTGVMRRIGE